MRRHFVGSQSFLAKGLDLVLGGCLSWLEHDPGFDRLTAVWIGYARYADFEYFWLGGDDFVHLPRPHLEAARLV